MGKAGHLETCAYRYYDNMNPLLPESMFNFFAFFVSCRVFILIKLLLSSALTSF